MERWERQFDKLVNITKDAIRIAEERTAILLKLEEAKIPELLIGLEKGELVIVKKEDAVCPVCGYEFDSPPF